MTVAWPASSAFSSRMAFTALSTLVTATASAAVPSAAATAASAPDSTVSIAATLPSRPESRSVAASRAPAPSLRFRPSSRASLRAAKPACSFCGLALGGAQLGELLLGLGQRLRGLFDLVVEPAAVRLQALDLGLELVVLALHAGGPAPGLLGGGAAGGRSRRRRRRPWTRIAPTRPSSLARLSRWSAAARTEAASRRSSCCSAVSASVALHDRAGQALLRLGDLLGEVGLFLADPRWPRACISSGSRPCRSSRARCARRCGRARRPAGPSRGSAPSGS